MNYFKLFIVFTLPIVFQSCYSARPIAELSCFQEDITYANGKQVIKTESPNFTTFTVYERNETDRLVFDIELFYTGDDAFIVEPSTFYYSYKTKNGKYNENNKKYAYNPEDEIINIRKKIAKGYANERNSVAHSVTLAATEIVLSAAAAAITSEISEDEISSEFSGFTSSRELANAAINQIAEAENDYDYYNNSVLRKHTLKSGESIRGKVFFPYDPKITHVVLHYPLVTDTLTISYIQQALPAD